MIKDEDILLPKTAIEYLNDASEQKKDYLKVSAIRIAFDEIINTVFVYLSNKNVTKWEDKTINERLQSVEKFFPNDILNKLHHIRKYANNGPHKNLHAKLTPEETSSLMNDIQHVCEWVLTSYFIKYGFNKEDWVATILSTLPPIFRINILEPVFQNLKNSIDKNKLINYLNEVQTYNKEMMDTIISGNIDKVEGLKIISQSNPSKDDDTHSNFLLLIDKLSLAYMKNRDIDKSHEFISQCLCDGYINNQFYDEMIDEVDSLYNQIDTLPISKNLNDTKKKLNELLPEIEKSNCKLFGMIFLSIVSQN